jgi:hypothetical protein
MRLITSLQGSVAIKYSPDEAAPDVSVLTRDIVAFLGDAYEFSVKPEVPPGLVLTSQPFVFQTGKVKLGEHTHPISVLVIVGGGMLITAKDTDTAEIIAEEVISSLEGTFGFKIHQSIRMRYYHSNLAVELNAYTGTFTAVQKILNEQVPRPGKPFELKRLAFGYGDVANPFAVFSIDDIPNSDFLLERRPGEPYEFNRYFASAPLTTREHERILSLIDQAMLQN